MSEKENSSHKDSSEQKLVIARVFDAPPALVFKAWADPKHVMNWWGPKHFSSPACKIDLRVGGSFLLCMRAPDGAEYWNAGSYREIIPSKKIVSVMYFSDKDGNILDPSHHGFASDFPKEMRDTVTFEPVEGNKTKLTLHRDTLLAVSKRYQEDTGWNQSLDRFGDELKRMAGTEMGTSDREIVISRIFDAPRELVWEAWTNPKHVVNWWGPQGFTTTIEVMDVRPGGVWKLVMHGPDGTAYPNQSVFLEVLKPERIVYAHSGSKAGEYAIEFQSTWTFADLAGKTELTIRHLFKTAADREQIAIKYGAIEGGKQTLGRLAGYLPILREQLAKK